MIQPLNSGIIEKIYVREGQAVKKGDILVELKPDSAIADQQRINDEISTLKHDILRLESIINWINKTPSNSHDIPDTLTALQHQLLHSQWQQYQSQLTTLKQEQNKYRSEQETVEQQVEKYQALLPILTRRAKKLKMLSEKQYLQEDQYLDIEQQRLTTYYDLKASQQRLHELTATIAEVTSKMEQTKKTFASDTITQLQQATKDYQSLSQEKIKADATREAQTLTAPVSGVVQQLVLHTEGGVVTPAQQLMLIVPDHQQLEVEAMVANLDIGFVKENQTVEIKTDAFPFTKYGVIDGILTHLSNDAIADEQLGFIYKAQVAMAKMDIQVEDKRVTLSPGMTVVVEIKTGQRRLIEYFLAPLLRYKQESIRER